MPSTKVLRRVAEALGTEASELLQAAEGTFEAMNMAPASQYFHMARRAPRRGGPVWNP